jgi:hypothetical protein
LEHLPTVTRADQVALGVDLLLEIDLPKASSTPRLGQQPVDLTPFLGTEFIIRSFNRSRKDYAEYARSHAKSVRNSGPQVAYFAFHKEVRDVAFR